MLKYYYYYSRFTAPWILSGTTRVNRYQKGKTRKVKTIWIYWSEIVSGSGISWAVCKPAPRTRQITMPESPTQFFIGRMPFLPPNQQRQSTEGSIMLNVINMLHITVFTKLAASLTEQMSPILVMFVLTWLPKRKVFELLHEPFTGQMPSYQSLSQKYYHELHHSENQITCEYEGSDVVHFDKAYSERRASLFVQ